MNYRKFGKTELLVSEIGFGAWAIGGNVMIGDLPIGWGPADDATSKKTIHAALDAGINFFDTPDFYGLGHSEDLLGNCLRNNREAIIATKAGQKPESGKVTGDYSFDYLVQACEASLRRLKRDHIDYFQLHTAKLHQLEQGDCIRAVELLKQQGKIRYWGISVSTFYPEPESDFLIANNKGDGLQLVFNLINHRARGVIEKASAAELGIIARMPLQFGLLTGKIKPGKKFPKDDHRNFRLDEDIISIAGELINKEWQPLAEKRNMSLLQLALSFIMSMPGVSTTIPGLRTPEQVAQNSTGLQQLSSQEMELLLSENKKREALVKLMEARG